MEFRPVHAGAADDLAEGQKPPVLAVGWERGTI